MLIHPYYVRGFLCIPEVFRTYPFHSVSQLYIPYTFHIRQLRLHDNCSFISVKRVLGTEKAVNLKDQLLITALLDLSAVILALSTLSFLGLSSQPPLPEWGSMLYENRNYLDSAPHLLIYPTLCIFISAFLFNLLGQMYASRHAQGRINL